MVFWMSSSWAFAQTENKASATLKSATVFLSGAQLTYQTAFGIENGRNEIRVSNLPTDVIQNSIKVTLDGTATLLGVNFEVDYGKAILNPKIDKLNDSIELLNGQISDLREELAVYELEEQTLKNNQKLGSTQTGMNPADLKTLLEFTRQRGLEIKRIKIEINRKIHRLDENKQTLNNQIAELNNKPQKATGVLVLSILSRTEARVAASFSVRINNSGWTPIYDLKKDQKSPNISLALRGKVWQQTGFSWKDVKLTLSTSNPNENNQRPILSTLFVDYYMPQAVYDRVRLENTYGNRPSAAPSAKYKGAEMDENSAVPPQYEVTVNNNLMNAEYDIQLEQTIPTGGKPTIVPVMDYELPTTLAYHSVPKLREKAFLLAKVTDWGKFNLLPAETNLFVDGSFIGTTYIDPTAATDTLYISLGVDNRINVKRIVLNNFKEKKVLGSRIKETFAYDLVVKNNGTETIDMDLMDQVPISRNADITIEKVELSGGQFIEDSGGVLWTMKLKPGETRKVRLVYTVEYSKGKQINLR